MVSNKSGTENPAAMDEDFDAVAACRKGDVNAFQPLVEKYQKKMLTVPRLRAIRTV